ncbi:MAG: DUF3142 domain-containing protein [Bryobacteraceae bacterium]|jgi:hypothetical protein
MRAYRWAFLSLLMCACGTRPDPLPGFPRLVLWAWERPERLRFVDPHTTGVAFLTRTISWRGGQVESRPRLQPLEVPAGVALMAVVRLEGSGALPDAQALAEPILRDAARPGIQALQIDFDARQSERAWYRGLLERLRAGLAAGVPLSITALASWCDGDSWIRGLPVSDAVPMLFRMGAGEPRGVVRFRAALCQSSLGISTDEWPAQAPSGRRLFVFHPRAWDVETYRGVLVRARRWE